MSETNEQDAFAVAVESQQDALAQVIEELVYNSALAIFQGNATPKMLKASLKEQGIPPREAEYIVGLATTMAKKAVRQSKLAKRLRGAEEPWYLREHRRQLDAAYHNDIMNAGGALLVLAFFAVAVAGVPTHGRGQGILAVAVLFGAGAIAFGLWGRAKDAVSRIFNR